MNMPTQLHEEDVKALEQEKPQPKEVKVTAKAATGRSSGKKSETNKTTKPQQVQEDQVNQEIRVYDTIVIGAGISGLAAAHRMNEQGYHDYIVLEKANRVGGTWRDNTYPGCGCDVPSALYSFSFAPSHQWSHLFAKQPEILNYLEDVAEQQGLYPNIQFNCELKHAEWNEDLKQWQLETSRGPYIARTVIFSTGPITEPQIPKIKGIESFKGEMFHSARWNHQFDLTDKRIAVIGTGASAIQFIPQIQPIAKNVVVFQRTAPWVLPKADFPLNDRAKGLMTRFPKIQDTWRKSVAKILNGINLGLRNPTLLEPINYLGRQLLKLQIQNDDLREKVTPNFSIGCKRLLFANNYYPALQQPNVDLIPHGLVEIEGNTVIAANGERFEVDVIIWGTGFEVSHPPIGRRVKNAQGQLLSELWKNSSPEAFLGTSIAQVPNAFLVLGPNILVYDSFIGIAEAQVGYIVDALVKMKQNKIQRLEIKPKVLAYHNAKVQTHLQTTVFNRGGCKSYYLDANGRNFAAWPWSLSHLKQRLAQVNLEDYDTVA
ncbi:cyclohexanone monooxygenase [Acinetobacter sp. ANC 5054]|uniref:flavin-containing monooxygenase n=1 Tax=Acinetobacter sp. ANC 5054 TaxID=1977877 RepID=UPI000A34168D|nr:NAD(P)/FAD-dependent oxidoreductase [Acinetobacter sp. ANC 5054]OTG79934.1 cyclohexanone monooxygenase [Acinetobacter sp. ANC 5054]